jgi:predicted Holliday junction resolvase-like endonuclease
MLWLIAGLLVVIAALLFTIILVIQVETREIRNAIERQSKKLAPNWDQSRLITPNYRVLDLT